MKPKLIAFLGITSPLVLLSVCIAATVLIGIAGWWLVDQDESSRIIRIMSLAPLTTPQAIESETAQIDEPDSPTSPELSKGETQVQAEPTATEIIEAEPDIPLTAEEVEESLGFAIPTGSVNSITQEGLAHRLVIPGLNLDAPIVLSPIENQTWKVDHLGQSVGHLEGTAPPGSNSNLVLAAHVTLSTGVNGPFANLGQLVPGDILYVYDEGQEFQYVVDKAQTVDRTAVEVTFPTETGQITLITCSNWDRNQQRYTERLIVTGHLSAG